MTADVKIWTIALDQPELTGVDVLSADERERAGRFRFSRDRTRYVLAHVALRRILAEATGTPPHRLAFVIGPQGKPALVGPGGPHFNLSHSDELAVLAVSTAGPLGVDVEAVRPIPEFDTVAEAHFSPAELDALRALPPGEREHGFYRLWTRKEAYLKAIGTGLSHPLHGFTVNIDHAHSRIVDVAGDADEAAAWRLPALDLPPPYVGALAMRAPAVAVSLRHWRP